MNIERVIEDALVTRIKARTYISTNSIPVRRFNDRTTVDGVKCVVVRCRSVERVDPSYQYYRVNLELISKSYLQADLEGDDVTDIYEEWADNYCERVF